MTDRTCTRCGSPIVAGAHFCSRCGHDVSGEQAVLATAKMAPVDVPPPPAAPEPAQSEILEPLRKATTGEYDVAGELGRGGMATVFLAHDIALDRKVAIKVMTPSLVTGAGMVERFKREARTAASLSHPHIIPIYAVKETGNLLYFVMKFVEGRSLDTIIREQGPLPVHLVQAIMAQVGGALGYAHRRGIVHRDIKPANIMLDDEGWAVVTDFGIAKVADARGLTMTGVTIGTPSYMSPEQCASKEITGATDQYSLGIVAFELLTGRIPFDADSLMGIMWKHFNEPPPPIQNFRPDCPPNVAEAITRMLAKPPDERWATLEDAVAAIGQPPMAPGDPIRQEMRALAHGGDASLSARVHTPASPIPTGGVSTDAPTMPSSAAPIPSGIQRQVTPPPTPPPATGGVSMADARTISTSDYAAGDVDATVVARPTGAPQPAPAAFPTQPMPTPAAAGYGEEPAPRRRTPLMAAGLAALAVASAAGVWGLMSVSSGGGDASADSTTVAEDFTAAPPPAPVALLTLNQQSQSLAVGATGELLAFLVDSANTPLSDRVIEWRAADPSIASVRAGQGVAGMVEGLKAGTTRIIATSEGKADTATVTVTATRASVASVAVQLQTSELAPGDTVPVSVLVRDAQGGNLGGRTVQLASSATNVVRVAGTRLIAVAAGTAVITATSEGVSSDAARVTVAVPAIQSVAVRGPTTPLDQGGTGVRLGLTVLDTRNRPVTDYRATWQSSNPRVVTVADGAVQPIGEGEATITATVDGKQGTFTIRVRPPARTEVARVQISGTVGTLDVGGTHKVSGAALDAGGGRLLDRAVTWQSSNPAVASIGNDGSIQARTAGRVTITATSEGRTATFDLEVTVRPADEPPAAVEAPPTTPTPAAPAVTAASLGLGAEFSCATLSDGSAQCWGANAPPRAPGANARLQSVVSGAGHACGLAGDGGVLCWGNNRYGQLGNGESANQNGGPARVSTDARFRSLAAGADHTCGIATDGKAWCWGRGDNGRLGNNSTQSRNTPVEVERDLTFSVLAAGEKHTCGIAGDGKTWCWGDGFSEQLGIGVTEERRTPDEVRTSGTFTVIAAGKESNCAAGPDGTYCWGRGFSSTPRKVETDLPFVQLAVGQEFACGMTRAGAVSCWGKNDKGQLGDGSGRNQRAPVAVILPQPAQTIAAGNTHACAVTRNGPTLCWGENAKGQVGTGASGTVPTPAPVEIRR